jgi:membrane protein YdbS with pleckstrin-like domain
VNDLVESGAGQATIFDGEEHPVDPRSVKAARMIRLPVTLLIGLVPLTGITLGWLLADMPNPVYFSLLAVMLLLLSSLVTIAWKWPAVRHNRLRYRVDDGGMVIRSGVLWRKVICISITRVQHTDFTQGPIQRRFELATLTVHTAGTAGASISLAGLEHDIARRLCDHLRPDRSINAG